MKMYVAGWGLYEKCNQMAAPFQSLYGLHKYSMWMMFIHITHSKADSSVQLQIKYISFLYIYEKEFCIMDEMMEVFIDGVHRPFIFLRFKSKEEKKTQN